MNKDKKPVKFTMDVTCVVELTVAQEVLSVVDDEWRAELYNFRRDDIAEHLAFNAMRGVPLSLLDGWRDQPDSNMEHDITDLDVITMSIAESQEE